MLRDAMAGESGIGPIDGGLVPLSSALALGAAATAWNAMQKSMPTKTIAL